MLEEALQQRGPAPQGAHFAADGVMDLRHRVGREVRETAVFEIGPELLDGIELGGVGWEPFDMPVRAGGQPPADLAMAVRAAQIPQHDDWAPAVEVTQTLEHLGAPDIHAGMKSQVKGQAPAPGGHAEHADTRDLLMGPRPDGQPRGHPPERPSAAQKRGHQEARFIQADQPGTETSQFF